MSVSHEYHWCLFALERFPIVNLNILWLCYHRRVCLFVYIAQESRGDKNPAFNFVCTCYFNTFVCTVSYCALIRAHAALMNIGTVNSSCD